MYSTLILIVPHALGLDDFFVVGGAVAVALSSGVCGLNVRGNFVGGTSPPGSFAER